ncbi:MAG TPA: class I SAM-dependent methyltransferase, partial [Ignavibacteria bacterium]
MNKIDGRNFYDQISETYDENVNRGVIAGKIRTYIQESILKNITKNGTILDIGCGTGTDAIFFAEKGIKVLGFDVSHKMIEAAKYKAANKRLQQLVNFIEMDASDLKKLNNMKFDAAVSN